MVWVAPEERVLRMRFGIGMNTDHTLEEVGQQFSVKYGHSADPFVSIAYSKFPRNPFAPRDYSLKPTGRIFSRLGFAA